MLAIARSIFASVFCFLFAVPAAKAAPDDWPTYRRDSARTGTQTVPSDLSDPDKIVGLHVIAQFPLDPPAPGGFTVPGGFMASPIVVDGTAFIGDVNGYFYAFDAASGKLKWQYPKAGDHGLGVDTCRDPSAGGGDPFAGNYGTYGIRTGATSTVIGGQPAVIFGAPDPTAPPLDPHGNGWGSARLFAFPLSGPLPDPKKPWIWESDVVAQVTGCHPCRQTDDHSSTTCQQAYNEKHERIAYSSPLVLYDKVYVGIHDTGDSPIQQGRVVAVDLDSGHMVKGFQFFGAVNSLNEPTRGGSVWNALATDGTGVFFTTGNTHDPWCSFPYYPPLCPVDARSGLMAPEPQTNNGLSMIRVDKDTGNIVWKYQPVPFTMDGDPDWAAGATVMSTSCGELIASVQKDGWSYAIDANQPNPAPSCPLTGNSWQFPPTTKGCPFRLIADGWLQHGDDDYRRPGAAWNDVFIVRTGGWTNTDYSPCRCEPDPTDPNCVCRGHKELHALNACATSEQDRVRWIAGIPDLIGAQFGAQDSLPRHISYSSPTVTGGIVFIGTNQNPIDKQGHLVVLADPSIVAASQQVCSNVDFHVADCAAQGYATVWSPQVLFDQAMPDGGSLASMRNEPVLAEGRVFVATHPVASDSRDPGHVYILAAGLPSPPGPPFPDPEATTIAPEILAPDSVPTIIESVTPIIESVTTIIE